MSFGAQEKVRVMRKNLTLVLICLASVIAAALIFLFVVAPALTRPERELSPLAKEWRESGSYIRWQSTLKENRSFGMLDIFTIQKGNPENPAILMIHGYPTSSFDFYELFDLLSEEYCVSAIDTPGYGLSDKPLGGYIYSIEDDARLVDQYIREILELESLALYTHDKGASVGLALLGVYAQQDEYEITHQFITNGNIYLPLADLTTGQLLLLHPLTGPVVTRLINGNRMAKGMNLRLHAVPESSDKVAAVASMIDYQDGGEVQHSTIQYLNQRREHEDDWLANLRSSTVPATIIWGVEDPVAPLKVADYVWSEILRERRTEAWYWQLPQANHYPQNDRPEVISMLIRQALGAPGDASKIDGGIRPISVN
jgi:pimeloyl-ACP methyl ester carboxylesterase